MGNSSGIQCFVNACSLYDNMWDDGNSLGPKEVHNYLKRVMYNRRNKFNPLWNSLVLGGVKNGQKYLGTVKHNTLSCLILDRSSQLHPLLIMLVFFSFIP